MLYDRIWVFVCQLHSYMLACSQPWQTGKHKKKYLLTSLNKVPKQWETIGDSQICTNRRYFHFDQCARYGQRRV